MIALKTGVRIWQCNKKLGKEIWLWSLNCPENMMALKKTSQKIWQCNEKRGKEI